MSSPPIHAVWRARLFGTFRLVRVGGVGADGAILTHFESQRAVALLAFLILHPGVDHPREILADRIWPDAELDVARNRLKQTLASLRRLVEPPGVETGSVLVATRKTIALASGAIESDYHDAMIALALGDRETAESLVSGELLPGLYDEWLDEPRHWWDSQALEPSGRVPIEASQPRVTPPSRSRLPHYSTAFFGREAEAGSILEKLSLSRVVTVTGFGGAGKTRLTVHVANQWQDDAVFVPMADLTHPDQVLPAIASALGVALPPNANVASVVAQSLGTSSTLLVLDNAEQLVSRPLAQLLTQLIRECPEVRLLISSRIPLGMYGEDDLALHPLVVEAATVGAPELAALPSSQLFIDRARKSRADFQVTARNAEAFATLLHKLGGVPLAIELCAAWAHVISIPQMIARLDASEGGALLTSRRRDIPDRQRSLHDAFDTTMALLTAEQRTLLIQVSALRGGLSEDMARALCAPEFSLNALSELAQAALIRPVERERAIVYTMLESLRQFVHSLPEAEPILRETRERATDLFSTLARQSRRKDSNTLFGISTELDWVQFLDQNWENLNDVVTHAIAAGNLQAAGEILFHTDWYWILRSRTYTAVELMRHCLQAQASDRDRSMDSDTELGISALHAYFSRAELSFARINQTLASMRAVWSGETMGEAVAEVLYLLAWARSNRLDYDGLIGELEELVSVYEALGLKWRVGMTERLKAQVYIELEDHAAAAVAMDRAERLFREEQRDYYLAVLLYDRARLLFEKGEFSTVAYILDDTAALVAPYQDLALDARLDNMRGRTALALGSPRSAIEHFARSIRVLIELRDLRGAVFPVENLGRHLAAQGRFAETVPIWAWANRAWVEVTGEALDDDDQRAREEILQGARQALGEELTLHLIRKGESMSPNQLAEFIAALKTE